MKTKAIFIYIILLFMAQVSYSVPLQYDSSKVVLRKFDNEKIEQLKKSKKYNYGKDRLNNKPDNNYIQKLITRIIEKIYNTIFKNWSDISIANKIFRIVLYIIFIVFILYLVLQIFNIKDIFGKNKKIIDLPYDIEKENIHELDFFQLINKALENKQYRLATRLQYLQTIKTLSDKNLIVWSMEKTNKHYIVELNPIYRNDFMNLTRIFDWVWYGEYLIDKNEYEKYAVQFNNFNKSIR